jgi:hypothetical protein
MPYSYKYKKLKSIDERAAISHVKGFIIFNTLTDEEGAIYFDREEEAILTCLELNLMEQDMGGQSHH